MAKRKAQGVVVRQQKAPKEPKEVPPKELAEVGSKAAAASPAVLSAAAAPGGSKKKRRRSAVPCAAEAAADAADSDNEAAAAEACEDGAAEPPPSPLNTRPFAAGGGGATEVLAWLLWPMTPATFFAEYWEKKPLHVRRGRPGFYGSLFSKAVIDGYLRSSADMAYGKRINLVRFDEKTGLKVDLNKGARGTRAKPEEVDEAWAEGASMQVMHPQHFHEPAWRLLAALEGACGALFGANAYLTPNGCQGLAPHFDDVEVFMLQLEGSKRWRLHTPPAGEEYPLPREYSRDFKPEELDEPILACVLEPGDLLYLPRGTVHHGSTPESTSTGFSHHLTVSTYQRTAWCDVLEKALSTAVERAATASPQFRQGLPVNFMGYMGSWHDVGDGEEELPRAAFSRRFKALLKQLHDFVDLDEVCDALAVDFTASRLPPAPPLPVEAAAADAAAAGQGAAAALTAESRVRLRDLSAVRAMMSSDPETSEAAVMVFHSTANNREAHMNRMVEAEEDVGCLRFEAATFLPPIRALFAAGAAAVRCGDLPLKEEDDRVALCTNLRDAGLLELC